MNFLVLLNSFLGVDFYDNDFEKLIFKFTITFIFIFITVRGLYYPNSKKKDYAFSFLMLGIVIFFISFTLKKFELGTGMALGLFAIFGIIRYRTDTMPVKEMTYLFIVIGISVINALANKKVSYTELLFSNLAIIGITYGIEKLWFSKDSSKQIVKPPKTDLKQAIIYNNIEYLKPENKELLLKDLQQKTGLNVNRIKIELIDYETNTAKINIYYPNEVLTQT